MDVNKGEESRGIVLRESNPPPLKLKPKILKIISLGKPCFADMSAPVSDGWRQVAIATLKRSERSRDVGKIGKASTMYEWIKALHVIAVISWMAGMLYLPRLFVYHCEAEAGSKQSETFKVMERRLLKAIINPAMIVTWLAGSLSGVARAHGSFRRAGFMANSAGTALRASTDFFPDG